MTLSRAIGWTVVAVLAIAAYLAFCGWWGSLIGTLYGARDMWALPILFSPWIVLAAALLFFMLRHREPS